MVNTARFGVSVAAIVPACVSELRRSPITSSHGRASVMPAPFRKVRRGSGSR